MFSADILGERARLTPDKTALVYVPTGERFTYADMDGRALRCAAQWHALGLGKGERVAVLARSRPEYLDAFFAAGKTGIVLVPLNARQTAHELQYVIQDAGCRALMFDSTYAETVRGLRESIALDHWIDVDSVGFRSPDHPITGSPDAEDLYCLLYTSGTTGRPKGVMIPHRMVAANAFNTLVSWQLRDTDISPIFTPLYHAGGLAVSLTAMFLIGGTIVLHERFDAAEVLRTIERERCTIVFGVPTIFKMLLDAPEFASADLSSVRWAISGGAPLPLYITEAWQRRGIVFKQGYGLTEVGVNCFAMTVEDSVRRPGSIGKPMMFTEAKIVVPKCRSLDSRANPGALARDDKPLGDQSPDRPITRSPDDPITGSPDDVGELWLRGPHVCRGYWNNPEATTAALDEQGWFHTGDLARCDADGFFYIAGRLKDMIISGGMNIYTAEIEAELLQHPAVRDAAVIGVPHETWGEVGVAYIVTRAPVTVDELTSFLGARLARYKIPRELIYMEELPRTVYGKILKTELRADWERRRLRAAVLP